MPPQFLNAWILVSFFFTLFSCLKLGFDLCFFFFHFLLLYFVAKSLSLITVCRECIERKIVDENLNHCPICNVDLGCSPLDKLRYVSGVQYISVSLSVGHCNDICHKLYMCCVSVSYIVRFVSLLVLPFVEFS